MFSDGKAAIIADDLTGAAEIGGVATLHGIPAEIHIDRPFRIREGLAIIDTDTRCRPGIEAAETVEGVARELSLHHPGGPIFKKVDSLLRGNVAAELAALLRVGGASRVLLVPANPALSRTIRDGVYFVGGVPISATEFATDPRHPVASSRVLEMLGHPPGFSVALATPGQPPPRSGIVVAETASREDLDYWAEKSRAEGLWAGGAAFFAALLRANGYSERTVRQPGRASRKVLLVSGSASQTSRSHLESLCRTGVPVIHMPPSLFHGRGERPDEGIEAWATEVAQALRRRDYVAVAIGHALKPGEAGRLARRLSAVVKSVLGRVAADHLWIEGGETASGIVRHLRWNRLRVLRQIVPGVVELRPEPSGPLLTVKPGSYPWPQEATGTDR